MDTLPEEIIAIIRGYLSLTSNTMLSLSSKRMLAISPSPCVVERRDVVSSVSLLLYALRLDGDDIPHVICPWTLPYAASGGYTSTLIWLRENGAPISEALHIRAATNGHLDTLIWLCNNGSLWYRTASYLHSCAARNGHSHILRWLHSVGVLSETDM